MQRNQPSTADGSIWIPVSAQTPKSHFRVLIAYLPGFHVDPATGKKRARRWQIMFARFAGGQWRFLAKNEKTRKPNRVRYWMPLPRVPKEVA